MRFTKTNVSKIKPPAGKADHVEWDEAMPGFGIRFRNGRDGVWHIQYRVNGRTGKMTFGHVARVDLAAAQELARDAFKLVELGKDPAVEKVKTAAKMVLFKAKIDPYLAHLKTLGRAQKYIEDNRRSLGGDFGTEHEVTGYFSALHKLAFREIEQSLVAEQLGKIEKTNGTGAMRNSRAHLNAYLRWARQEGLLDIHPGEGTRKPPTVKRDRFLEPQEIMVVWKLLDPADDFGAISQLLWFTWARRDEIAQLRRSEVDRKRRLIDLPPERTKNGVRLIIPLSVQAWAVLEPKLDQRANSDFVFGSGAGGFSGWDRAVNRLRDASELKHFTLHDFRRTARSLGVRKPVSIMPHIGEAILNHISTAESGKQGVAGVYDVNDPWQYHEEKTEALQKWADYLSGLTEPKLSQAA